MEAIANKEQEISKSIIAYIKRYRPDSLDIQAEFGWAGLVRIIKLQEDGVVERRHSGVRAWYVVAETVE